MATPTGISTRIKKIAAAKPRPPRKSPSAIILASTDKGKNTDKCGNERSKKRQKDDDQQSIHSDLKVGCRFGTTQLTKCEMAHDGGHSGGKD